MASSRSLSHQASQSSFSDAATRRLEQTNAALDELVSQLKRREAYLNRDLSLKEAELGMYYKHIGSLQQRLDASDAQLGQAQTQIADFNELVMENNKLLEHYKGRYTESTNSLLQAEEQNIQQCREIVELQNLVEELRSAFGNTSSLHQSTSTPIAQSNQTSAIPSPLAIGQAQQQALLDLQQAKDSSVPTLNNYPSPNTPPILSALSHRQSTHQVAQQPQSFPTDFAVPLRPAPSTASKKLYPQSATSTPLNSSPEKNEGVLSSSQPLLVEPKKGTVTLSPVPNSHPPTSHSSMATAKPQPTMTAGQDETLMENLRATAAALASQPNGSSVTAGPSSTFQLTSSSEGPSIGEDPNAATRRWLDGQLLGPKKPAISTDVAEESALGSNRLINFSNENSPTYGDGGEGNRKSFELRMPLASLQDTRPHSQVQTPVRVHTQSKGNTALTNSPSTPSPQQQQPFAIPKPGSLTPKAKITHVGREPSAFYLCYPSTASAATSAGTKANNCSSGTSDLEEGEVVEDSPPISPSMFPRTIPTAATPTFSRSIKESSPGSEGRKNEVEPMGKTSKKGSISGTRALGGLLDNDVKAMVLKKNAWGLEDHILYATKFDCRFHGPYARDLCNNKWEAVPIQGQKAQAWILEASTRHQL